MLNTAIQSKNIRQNFEIWQKNWVMYQSLLRNVRYTWLVYRYHELVAESASDPLNNRYKCALNL